MRLHHVGVVVRDRRALDDLMGALGYQPLYSGRMEEFGCECIFVGRPGETLIEYILPDPDSPLARFNQGAGGIHHYAELVPDIAAKTRELESKGLKLLLPSPVRGAGNFVCNFLAPDQTMGVLIEYVQEGQPTIDPR